MGMQELLQMSVAELSAMFEQAVVEMAIKSGRDPQKAIDSAWRAIRSNRLRYGGITCNH